MPEIDKSALDAFVAAVKNTPDAAIAVNFLPNGDVKMQGGTLSPTALALAKQVRRR